MARYRSLAVAFLLALGTACGQSPPPSPPPPLADVKLAPVAAAAHVGDIHLALGNPSNAKLDPEDRNNYLMVKPQFALSYNDRRGTPNWVSYYLKRADMGRAPRPQFFSPDQDLPRGFHRVVAGDYFYNKTGLTRGHMCPSSHRNATEASSQSTFVMTNMVPQTEELNGGSWELLESYCRDLCFDEGKEMMIVCGPHGQGSTNDRGHILTVGNGRVIVPKHTWKVVLVFDGGGTRGPLARVNNKSRLIAVLMPNTREPNENVPWSKYVVSAADIESLTGLSFFDKVPADIIGPLKKRVDEAKNGDRGARELARLR